MIEGDAREQLRVQRRHGTANARASAKSQYYMTAQPVGEQLRHENETEIVSDQEERCFCRRRTDPAVGVRYVAPTIYDHRQRGRGRDGRSVNIIAYFYCSECQEQEGGRSDAKREERVLPDNYEGTARFQCESHCSASNIRHWRLRTAARRAQNMSASCHEEDADNQPSPVEMAQELSERGEPYLALSVILEAMNAQLHIPNTSAEWTVLTEVLKAIAIHRAAEQAYAITSFLDRTGLQPVDECNNNDNQIEDAQGKNSNRDEQHSGFDAQDDETSSRKCSGFTTQDDEECSRKCSCPSLISDSEDRSSRSGTISNPSTSRISSTPRWSHIRRRPREWKDSIKTCWKKVFRKRSDRALRLTSNQDDHEQLRARQPSTSHEEDEYSFRYQARRTQHPVSEQSTSSSWSCGLWALSECDVLGMSETSEAVATSYAILEDRCPSRRECRNEIDVGRPRGIIRFFESFRSRSPRELCR